jgi:hypothetical protein
MDMEKKRDSEDLFFCKIQAAGVKVGKSVLLPEPNEP